MITRGRIQAFPVGLPDEQKGEVQFVVDEPSLLNDPETGQTFEPHCDLDLDALHGVWRVRTPDGRRLIVPLSQAIVIEADEAKVQGPGVAGAVAKVFQPAKQLPKPVYTCKCGNTFTRRADRMICAARDAADPPTWANAGDCEKCGYPTGLHASDPGHPRTCLLAVEDGAFESVPWHHTYVPKPSSDCPHCRHPVRRHVESRLSDRKCVVKFLVIPEGKDTADAREEAREVPWPEQPVDEATL